MKLSGSVQRLTTETAFTVLAEVARLRAQGKDILSFAIGEPDFDTPGHIREAAKAALDRGETHYTPPPGILPLREAIADSIASTRHVSVSPEQVCVMPGAKPALFHGIVTCAGPGDEVIYPNPGFPTYRSVIEYAGALPVPLPLVEQREFAFDHDRLRALVNDRTALIILNSPHNPTGGVLQPEDVEVVAELAHKHDCWILSDEVYSRLVYDGEFHSPYHLPGMTQRTLLVEGFSKTYAMTGWRLGYAVVPPALLEPLTTFLVNTVSCTAAFSQYGALAALTGPQDFVEAMRAEFLDRRELLVEGLNALPGVHCLLPRGAFYAFPNVTELCKRWNLPDAAALQKDLLHEAGVAVLARTCFGPRNEGETGEYLRFSYATSREVIAEGLRRLAEAIEARVG